MRVGTIDYSIVTKGSQRSFPLFDILRGNVVPTVIGSQVKGVPGDHKGVIKICRGGVGKHESVLR